MENHTFTITYKKKQHAFSISDHPHYDGERCKYKVFENGQMLASFTPDAHQCLHQCQNPGNLEDKLVHELASKIEAELPHPPAKHIMQDA